jgi:diacylglycerol kinase family enzyme
LHPENNVASTWENKRQDLHQQLIDWNLSVPGSGTEAAQKAVVEWTAIVLALPRVLRHLPLFRLKIRIQGLVEPCRGPCVLIGNNEYRLTVPAFGRRDGLDRGELCVYVAKVQSRTSMFSLACRCILGLLDQQRDLRIFKGDTADISSRRSRLARCVRR